MPSSATPAPSAAWTPGRGASPPGQTSLLKILLPRRGKPLNAQKCTGPKTEEGKARSLQNAVKTGLYSESEVIGSESRDDYNSLIAEYRNHFTPATPKECSLVDALIRYEWLSRRQSKRKSEHAESPLRDPTAPQIPEPQQ